MPNIFNADFREFIAALNNNKVEYLLVGGYAVILHGYRRTTGDLDIWVNTTEENYEKLLKAYRAFGLPATDITPDNFLHNDNIEVFTYGVPPVCIEIMKVVKGCKFSDAYQMCEVFNENGLVIRFLHLNTLIQAKKAAGRYKDLDDIEKLFGL